MNQSLSLAADHPETGAGPSPAPEPGPGANRSGINQWSAKRPSGFGRSFGGALLLEFGLLVALTVWVANRPAPPPAKAPARVAVHMITTPVPQPPVPVFASSRVTPAPMPVLSTLPVIAVAQQASVMPTAFQVPVAPAPAAVPVTTTVDPLQQYTVRLNAAIQSGLVVPGMVRAMGLHGVTTVVFRLTPAGKLLWARIGHSSGVPPIDAAALARVKTTVYPEFPAQLPQRDTTFEIAVKLSADRS